MKKNVMLLFIGLSLLFSCSVAEQDFNEVSSENGIVDVNGESMTGYAVTPVKLVSSEFNTEQAPALYTMNYVTKGVVKVYNYSFEKEVVVHYSDNGGVWHTVAGEFSHSGRDNYEYWTFTVKSSVYKYPRDGVNSFAVMYRSNGNEYWDNNNGMNYDGTKVNAGNIKLKDASYTSYSVAPYTLKNKLSGEVYVKNIAYQKEVLIAVSNTQSGHITTWTYYPATYKKAGKDGYEIWDFSIEKDLYMASFRRFAIVYRVNGVEYWDNNLDRDYSVSNF